MRKKDDSLVRPAYPATIRVLSIKDAAQVLGVSTSTLWEWARIYPDFPVAALSGKTFRIREDLLLDWVGSRVGKEPLQLSEGVTTRERRHRRERSTEHPGEYAETRARQMQAAANQPLNRDRLKGEMPNA